MLIERRVFLQMLPGTAGVVAALLPSRLRAQGKLLTFDDAISQIVALAKALRAGETRDEERYLREVRSLVTGVGTVPRTRLGKPYLGLMRVGMTHRGGGIIAVQWSMEPGLDYPAHDHPNYNGMTLGLEGEVRIRNFQVQGIAPPRRSPEPFLVRQTQDALVKPGEVHSMMTTTRDNIHMLHTGRHGARGLDIQTLVGQHVGFSFLDLVGKRRPDGSWQARWRPRK